MKAVTQADVRRFVQSVATRAMRPCPDIAKQLRDELRLEQLAAAITRALDEMDDLPAKPRRRDRRKKK